MSKFIKKIKVEKYKCLDGFEADGFQRVNLIGGKNNVGKTTLLEACLLSTSLDVKELYMFLLVVKTCRNAINICLTPSTSKNDEISSLIKEKDFSIYSNDDQHISYKLQNSKSGYDIKCLNEEYKKTYSELSDFISLNLNFTGFSLASSFISSSLVSDELLKININRLKLNNEYNDFNDYIKKLFHIENIDLIDNNPYIKQDNEYKPLSSYGQGLKSSINAISSLMGNNNGAIFIDEIENGIHHDILDKLWEIVLEISKEQNIQVFATTHSKECIASYARVCEKFGHKDISFIELGMNEDKRDAMVYSYDWFLETIEQDNELRGW